MSSVCRKEEKWLLCASFSHHSHVIKPKNVPEGLEGGMNASFSILSASRWCFSSRPLPFLKSSMFVPVGDPRLSLDLSSQPLPYTFWCVHVCLDVSSWLKSLRSEEVMKRDTRFVQGQRLMMEEVSCCQLCGREAFVTLFVFLLVMTHRTDCLYVHKLPSFGSPYAKFDTFLTQLCEMFVSGELQPEALASSLLVSAGFTHNTKHICTDMRNP